MITVSVAYAKADENFWREQLLQPGACCIDAIEASGVLTEFPEIDLETQKVGIFGVVCGLDTQLQDGDRVEIYRPIKIVPENLERKRYRLRPMEPVIERQGGS
jgi:putative ubiquitin-RnfH superfamily antitoxin RatB of RatAB toxin-antitoxin module